MRVATVDDDVSSFQEGQQSVDLLVYGVTSTNHHHDLSGLLQDFAELLKRVGSHDVLSLSTSLDELVNNGGGSVEHGDLEAMALHVQDEVLTHNGKTDQSNISRHFCFC